MKTGVGELHLRLHPHRPENGQVRRRPDQVLKQGRFPDPSLSTQHQRLALSPPDRIDQSVQQRALVSPTAQGRLSPWCAATSPHGPRLILKQTQASKRTSPRTASRSLRAVGTPRGATEQPAGPTPLDSLVAASATPAPGGRSRRRPPCSPRIARLSGAAGRHLLPKSAGFRIGAVNAGGAFPAFMRARYFWLVVPMSELADDGTRPCTCQGSLLWRSRFAGCGAVVGCPPVIHPGAPWAGRSVVRGSRAQSRPAAVGQIATPERNELARAFTGWSSRREWAFACAGGRGHGVARPSSGSPGGTG